MARILNISIISIFFVVTLFSLGMSQSETLSITTYYPSPVGTYRTLQWGNSTATSRGTLSPDQGSSIELGGAGAQPYITFSNKMNGPLFDARIILNGDDALIIEGANLGIGTIPNYTLDVAGNANVSGNLNIIGTLTKGAGTFLIDHPLDPKNKVLRHSFVESPEMKNIYDGIAVLDKKGEAVVILPDYFEALNINFRYQLTSVGAYAPVYIKEEIRGNKFIIAGGSPDLKVSWMVTGVRKDAYALSNPITVEEEKGLNNNYRKGQYIHPEAFVDN